MKEWFKARNVWGAAITALSDEEAGRLAKAIWAYTMNGELIEIEGAGKGIFAMILMTLGQDEQYESELSKVRAKAGSLGGKQKQANVIKANQELANDSKSKQMVANDSNCYNKNKNKSKNKEKELEQDIMFERFWKAYPRKTSKPSAKKAFEKLDVDEELLATMLTAIGKQKNSSQWQENGGQFIPYPATWLNNKRWEDDVTEARQTKAVTAQAYTQRSYDEEQEEAMRRMFEEVI